MGGHGLPVETQNNIIVLVLISSRSRIVTHITPLLDNKAETYEFQSSAINNTSALLFANLFHEVKQLDQRYC